MARIKRIGILTAGGDSPGLNAAIRGFGKAAIGTHEMRLIGFRDGFRGLAEDRSMELDSSMLAGILTVGGTILGTSRDKPHRMTVDGVPQDMTGAIVRTYRRHRLDALLCIGGNGTAKNALRLVKAGLNIVMLPKTIDNDVVGTDASIGFNTALGIATDAIDRLHSKRYLGLEARRRATPRGPERDAADAELEAFDADHTGHSLRLARQLEALTGLESRVSILGYVQRGGTPSAADRVLAARLGRAGADLVAEGVFGVMVGSDGDETRPVPLEEVGGQLKTVPLGHPLVETARNVGTCLGD